MEHINLAIAVFSALMAIVSAFIAIIAIIVAAIVGYRFGDLAGTKHLIQHEKRQDDDKRKRIIIGLQAHMHLLLEINEHNKTVLDPEKGKTHVLPIQYPTEPFDLAFFSGNNTHVADNTISNVIAFMMKAKQLNVLIETIQRFYPRHPGGQEAVDLRDTKNHLKAETEKTGKLIDFLVFSLEEE